MKNSFLFFDGTNRKKAFFLSLLSTVHKQAFAGFLFVLTSLPVFTVLSSWTALWSVSKKLICGKEVRTAKDYFSFFFGSFKGTILPSVFFPVLFVLGAYCAKVYFSLKTALSMFGGVLCVSFLVLLLLLFLFFPFAFEKRENGFFECFELFINRFWRLLLSLFLFLLICGTSLLLLPYSLPIVLTFCFPLSSMICAFFLDKEEDEE